jgi:hypothetical protein
VAFSLDTKHLNFIALPPDAIPSLNSALPPSIALVPSYERLSLLKSGISALIISSIEPSLSASLYSQ